MLQAHQSPLGRARSFLGHQCMESGRVSLKESSRCTTAREFDYSC